MNLPLETADLIAGVLGFLFTVALLSYLIDDNPLYRVALHIFIGVSVGYGTLVVAYQVILPRLAEPLQSGSPVEMGLALMPLALFLFLALKLSPRTARLGNISTAFLLGVGTAIAVGGAVFGTLIPQMQATWLSILPGAAGGFLNNLIVIVGTVTALLSFQFWWFGREGNEERLPATVMKWLSTVGQGFVVVALGTVYGGLILSGIAVFGERLSSIMQWFTTLGG